MSKKQNGASMAWNDNNNQTPPELDEVIKDFKTLTNSNLTLVNTYWVKCTLFLEKKYIFL